MCKFSSNTSGERSESGQSTTFIQKKSFKSMTPVGHMTLRAFLHWLITDWSFLLLTPSAEFLSRLPSPLHHDKSKKKAKKKKSSKRQTPTSTITMLSVDTFLHVCVCESVQTPAHTRYAAADKHTHTHTLAYTGPAHLCRTPPPFRSILLRSVCSFVCGIVGGVGVVRRG